MADKEKSTVRCSFCGKDASQVKRIIAGADGYICNECVELCFEIIKEDNKVEDGFDFDFELSKPKDIKAYLDSYVIGQAASMGAVLLSSGAKGKRFSLPNSNIMIHQPSGGAQGQASDIVIQAEQILKIKGNLNRILAENTGKDLETIERDTDRDFAMTAEEALKYGLIDKVIESNK